MEEFLLRVGVNSAAMVSGLQRAGAYAKAWGTTLVEDFQSRIGRMFGAAFIASKVMQFGSQVFHNVQEKILEISRAQRELPGASSNFLQGLFNFAERIGISYETLSRPMLKFKETLDAARANPQGKQMEDLMRYGIVTDSNDLKTQKYSTSIARLSDAYLKYGKNLQMVVDLSGKMNADFPAFLAMLDLGGEKLQAMDKFNFFSDISPAAINLSAGLFGAKKGVGQVVTATMANLTEKFLFTNRSPWMNLLYKDPMESRLEKNGEKANAQADAMAALGDTIEMDKQRVEANTKLTELMEKQRELTAEMKDIGKESLSEMANAAAKMTGYKSPLTYSMTPLMRDSLKIKRLEDRAELSWQREQVLSPKDSPYWQQAQDLRASNPFLKDTDQNPMKKTEVQLGVITEELKPVQDMAAWVNQQHGNGGAGAGGNVSRPGPLDF